MTGPMFLSFVPPIRAVFPSIAINLRLRAKFFRDWTNDPNARVCEVWIKYVGENHQGMFPHLFTYVSYAIPIDMSPQV